MPSEEKLARRKEFEKYKTSLLKQNGITSLICARCGYSNRSNHLHHITEVVYGGQDSADNLIPLCAECHHEWDACCAVGMSLGEFLVSVSSLTLRIATKQGAFNSTIPTNELLNALHISQFSANSFKDEDSDYWAELNKQNKLFNTYPYSDHDAMLTQHGSLCGAMQRLA